MKKALTFSSKQSYTDHMVCLKKAAKGWILMATQKNCAYSDEFAKAIVSTNGNFHRIVDNKSHTRIGREVRGFTNFGDNLDPTVPVSHRVTKYHLQKEK